MVSNRRRFLQTCALLPVAAAALRGVDPVVRPAKSRLTLGLAAYSFRTELDLKKPTMTLFDFVDRAATYPIEVVELTSYYFAATTAAYLAKLKTQCRERKLAISGVPIRNDFCVTDRTKLAAEISHVKTWIDHAATLEAPTVRIFAGNLPKGMPLEAVQRQVVASLQECADVAGKRGVTLVLENHGGITGTPEGLLALVKPVTGTALAVNVDTGNFRTADPYADLAKILPYGRTVQLKTELFPAGKPTEDADLPRLIRLLREANYDGAVILEYEAKDDPATAVPKVLKQLRALIG